MTPAVGEFHPELRMARFLPRSIVSPRTLGLVRRLTGLACHMWPSSATIEQVETHVSVRVFQSPPTGHPVPAVLFIHGGGYIMGNAALGDRFCRRAAEQLGVVAASVEYRLAPEHPFPTPLEDCYAALRWLADHPKVDSQRIAIVGESAGGGLAAALTLLADERREVRPVAQVLSYPMLDDRTAARTDIDHHGLRLWSQQNNALAWRAYLGPSADEVPPLAAPARCTHLSGLPPTWIGVGTNDLFHDENVTYAQRLRTAGVPCTLQLVPGAYHGFDRCQSRTAVSRAFLEARMTALQRAFTGTGRC